MHHVDEPTKIDLAEWKCPKLATAPGLSNSHCLWADVEEGQAKRSGGSRPNARCGRVATMRSSGSPSERRAEWYNGDCSARVGIVYKSMPHRRIAHIGTGARCLCTALLRRFGEALTRLRWAYKLSGSTGPSGRMPASRIRVDSGLAPEAALFDIQDLGVLGMSPMWRRSAPGVGEVGESAPKVERQELRGVFRLLDEECTERDWKRLQWTGEVAAGQASKCTRWMPWHRPAMKDVASCDKLRGAASKLRSGDFRMGKPGGSDPVISYGEANPGN